MTCLLANGLNAVIETQNSNRTAFNDLEAYAELMECMSEIQEIDARV